MKIVIQAVGCSRCNVYTRGYNGWYVAVGGCGIVGLCLRAEGISVYGGEKGP